MADSPMWVVINRACLLTGTVATVVAAFFAYEAVPYNPPAAHPAPSFLASFMTPLMGAIGFGLLATGLLAVGIIGLWKHRHPKVVRVHHDGVNEAITATDLSDARVIRHEGGGIAGRILRAVRKLSDPEQPLTQTDCDAIAWEVVRHVGAKLGDTLENEAFAKSREAIRKALHKGYMRAEGRKEFPDSKSCSNPNSYSAIHTDIPKAYWELAEVSPLASSPAYTDRDHTSPESPQAWGPRGWDEPNHYTDLRFSWAQVRKLWP